MRLFFALFKKECIIVLRDIHALLALFILPSIFIIIMSYALKDVSNGGQNLNCLYYIDENNSAELAENFKKSMGDLQGFNCQESGEINLAKNIDLLVKIPSSFFENFRDNANSSIGVELLYSPTLNQTAIYLFEALLKEKIILLYASPSDDEYEPIFVKNLSKPFIKSLPSSQKIPNGTEQSVPSWIVFAMFFILIPLSTVLIVERDQGTYRRLKSMGLSPFAFFAAKTLTYNIINLCQGMILLGMGVFVIPLFGMEALEISSLAAVFILLVSLSFAAIGFALFLAVICKSAAQAVIAGGISNILLGAIGGIMVPKYIMPPLMQQISNISPMSWGFDAFIDLFLYKTGFGGIIWNVAFLLLFGIILFLVSLYIFIKRKGE